MKSTSSAADWRESYTDLLHLGGTRRLPLILQNEVAECGLACLAMVASYHGHRTDLAALRGRFSLSLNGANFTTLMEFAARLKLSSQPVHIDDLDNLTELQMPCILHWGMHHFVVLYKADDKGAVIHDPALGVRHLTRDEISREFTGNVLELEPMPEFQSVDERRHVSLGALIGKVTGWRKNLAIIFGIAAALEALALAMPIVNQHMFDEVIVSGDRAMLNALVFGLLLLIGVQTLLSQARGWIITRLSAHLSLHWVGNVLNHMLHLPMSWFEKRQLGDVLSRFGSVGQIQNMLTTSAISGVLDGIMALATCAMMMTYNVVLGTIVIATVALYGLVRAVSYRPLREASQEALVLDAREQSCFLETIRAIGPIKLFGCELDRRARWMSMRTDSINRGMRTQLMGLWFGNINQLIGAVSGALVLWLGIGMVLDGAFTVGMLLAFTAYSGQFGARASSLIGLWIEYRMLSLHTERLADIVLAPAEPEAAAVRDIGALEARIELVDVGFRYSDAEPFVLRHVNLTIEPGESVAVTGPSGCGKTTLVKLILGTLIPTEGRIFYGGVPLDQLGLRTYRTMLAAVMQDDVLLSGSMAENITFFQHQPDPQWRDRCARLAMVHDAITAMPMGYETLVGDMGNSLSGGQKQRVLLARALYKRPKVLVMDEATSALDVALEQAVNANVAALGTTRIIVAHRPETIASAARVVTLRSGQLVSDAAPLTAPKHL
ncbi:ABC transporter [Massilia eurypsychrophila]|jgi:ATP-binding cassette subfamily B protein RaxB|uniref:ABC transporter n=1 Tax=Massilia eurypsychrophila TaxID=1485217 RepID=A0A2G8TFR0_9BURK|nr:peptidase domain-containing ABC transporter [Massilia eurypsychrophila]PIL44478.1 ABC transporter [Massilia eurypsychrophila]